MRRQETSVSLVQEEYSSYRKCDRLKYMEAPQEWGPSLYPVPSTEPGTY